MTSVSLSVNEYKSWGCFWESSAHLSGEVNPVKDITMTCQEKTKVLIQYPISWGGGEERAKPKQLFTSKYTLQFSLMALSSGQWPKAWIQAVKISFLQKYGWSHPQGQREELSHPRGAQSKVPAPPHQKEQVEVIRHLVMMLTNGGGVRTCPIGRKPRGRPRTHWRDYISRLTWERLVVPQER